MHLVGLGRRLGDLRVRVIRRRRGNVGARRRRRRELVVREVRRIRGHRVVEERRRIRRRGREMVRMRRERRPVRRRRRWRLRRRVVLKLARIPGTLLWRDLLPRWWRLVVLVGFRRRRRRRSHKPVSLLERVHPYTFSLMKATETAKATMMVEKEEEGLGYLDLWGLGTSRVVKSIREKTIE